MRIITLIILLLFQGIPLIASAGGALSADEISFVKSTEEVAAQWESESDAKLWGDRVHSDFKNRQVQGFSLNAFCSAESIEKLNKLRRLAADIISGSLKDGNSGSETLLAGELLNKALLAIEWKLA